MLVEIFATGQRKHELQSMGVVCNMHAGGNFGRASELPMKQRLPRFEAPTATPFQATEQRCRLLPSHREVMQIATCRVRLAAGMVRTQAYRARLQVVTRSALANFSRSRQGIHLKEPVAFRLCRRRSALVKYTSIAAMTVRLAASACAHDLQGDRSCSACVVAQIGCIGVRHQR